MDGETKGGSEKQREGVSRKGSCKVGTRVAMYVSARARKREQESKSREACESREAKARKREQGSVSERARA
eukprot:6173202-Pleurochrysis_carterae.AAC.9